MTLVSIALLGAIFTGAAAHAEPPEPNAAERPPDSEHYERMNAKLEGLGAVVGRYGVEVEVMATSRDSVAFYPFIVSEGLHGTKGFIEGDPDFTYTTQTRALGLDVQYRRYLGDHVGARGFYLAPGFELQSFTTDTTQQCASSYGYNNPGQSCPGDFPEVHQAFVYAGASFDVGGQAVTPAGLVLALSVGVHMRTVVGGSVDTSQMPWGWSIIDGPGVGFRLRAEVGWAFF
jgi:hypothetical protein